MKKIAPLFAFALATVSIISTLAQSSTNWTNSQQAPQEFIENHGQFDNYLPVTDTTIQFGIDHGFGWRVLFSPNKTSYIMSILEPDEEEASNEIERYHDGEPKGEIHSTIIEHEWLNINPGLQILSEEELHNYYTYSFTKDQQEINVNHAGAFKILRRNNLYNGIDIEYSAPENGGVKYKLNVAPGADVSAVSFKYTGATLTLDAEGNLRMPAVIGELVDHAPKAWYADNENEIIPCQFVLVDNVVSFSLGTYDHNRAIVIDPWTINPSLPAPFNRAFEVDCDNAGNVYCFGGGMGYNLKKYNAAGTLQWTHVSPWDTSNAWFGELLVIPGGTGVFITSGSAAKIRRLTAAGATTFTNNGPFFNLDEYWNLALSCDQTKLIATGTRLVSFSPNGFLFNLNMANGNQMAGSPYNIRPVGMQEIRTLITGGDGDYYMLAHDNVIRVNQAFGIVYSVAHGTPFPYGGVSYAAVNCQGMNAIDANLNYLYTMNGATLYQRNLGTGAIITSVAIPGGGYSGGFFGTGATNSGLVLDDCGNVFVGSTNAIYKYDANLNLLGSVATTGAVYDVMIGPGNVLLAGGNALLLSNTSLAPCLPKTITCTPPLPVELTNFTGFADGNINQLRWTTESEMNNDHFILEKSPDAVNYTSHATIDGAGNSNGILNYQATDTRPYPTTYYKLLQVDFNGDVKHYGPIVVSNDHLEGLQVQSIYPNPADENFTIQLFSENITSAEVQIIDALGHVIYQELYMVEGSALQQINSIGWSTGVYIIKVINKTSGAESNHRIIIN